MTHIDFNKKTWEVEEGIHAGRGNKNDTRATTLERESKPN